MTNSGEVVPRRGVRGWLALLFGLRARVDRRTYAIAGFTLMIAKYAIDATAVYVVTGALWTPLDYVSPLLANHSHKFGNEHGAFLVALLLWTLPFMWVGLSMTMRRAVDAGSTAGMGLTLYFIPFLNYAWMLLLCTLPSAPPLYPERAGQVLASRLAARATVAIALAIAVTAVLFTVSVYVLRSYGTSLFLGAPVLMGALCSYGYNRGELRPWKETLGVAVLCILVAFGALLLFALEGAVCIAMAMPIALPMACVGAVLGRSLAAVAAPKWTAVAVFPLALAGSNGVEASLERAAPYSVTTTVEIAAPREVVWRHVVSFCELPAPSWWAFELGLAHPLRATIDGRGVGAVRHCEFSTGAFVEPITTWDEPARLAFDVVDEPPPMHELSPWGQIQPPHLAHYFSSKRGEFRLTELPGDRTRLEGTTWYELRFAPASYWRWWSDVVVHHIHREVLEHVRGLSEADQR